MKNKKYINLCVAAFMTVAFILSGCSSEDDNMEKTEEVVEAVDETAADESAGEQETESKPEAELELEENEDADSILYPYDESFSGVNEDDDKTFAYDGADRDTSAFKWGAMATSIYAYMEEGDVDYLGAHKKNWDSWVDTREYLEKAWGITDITSAREVIDKTIIYGHQAKCRAFIKSDVATQKLIECIQRDFEDEFTLDDVLDIDEKYLEKYDISTEHFYRTKGAACAYVRFGDNALAAYDYVRLLRVVNMCEDCKYISADEFMNLIYNLDVNLQEKYIGFEDLHECYYYGELFRLADKNETTLAEMQGVEDAINTMNSDGYYSEIAERYGSPIEHDWDDIINTCKELRDSIN